MTQRQGKTIAGKKTAKSRYQEFACLRLLIPSLCQGYGVIGQLHQNAIRQMALFGINCVGNFCRPLNDPAAGACRKGEDVDQGARADGLFVFRATQ